MGQERGRTGGATGEEPLPVALWELPGGRLEPQEVEELWSFLHGDVMVSGIRRHLRAALGLCPRHTWAYAVVEIELWQVGAGRRGGHQPFEVCVLYEDLLDTVISRLARARLRWRADGDHLLSSRASCRICDALVGAGDPPPRHLGYGGFDTASLTEEANQLRFTAGWCRETEALWRPRVCPACLGQAPDAEVSCRLHLLEVGHLPASTRVAAAERLIDVRHRVGALSASMTATAPPAPPEADASWIEALGWFAGWSLPLALTSAPEAHPTCT